MSHVPLDHVRNLVPDAVSFGHGRYQVPDVSRGAM
jgi:hypothetical protein